MTDEPYYGRGVSHYFDGDAEVVSLPIRGRRLIRGVASTARVNAHRQSFLTSGLQLPALPMPLCFEHQVRTPNGDIAPVTSLGPTPNLWPHSVGKVLRVTKTPNEVSIVANVANGPVGDTIWKWITQGVLSGLSLWTPHRNFSGFEDEPEPGVPRHWVIDKWRFCEVSVCHEPSNPDCWLEILGEIA